MIAARIDLNIQKNRDFKHLFRNIPYDITDMTFDSEIRNYNNELIATFTIEKDTVNKAILLKLTEEQTKLLSSGLSYDIKQTDGNGDEISIIVGNINATKTITE